MIHQRPAEMKRRAITIGWVAISHELNGYLGITRVRKLGNPGDFQLNVTMYGSRMVTNYVPKFHAILSDTSREMAFL
jgi:hypothetical protein